MDFPIDRPTTRFSGRTRVRIMLAGGIIVVGVVCFYLLHLRSDKNASARYVEAVVKTGLVSYQVPGVGEFKPRQTLTIIAPTKSRVKQIAVEPGARMHKGDFLIALTDATSEKALIESKLKLQSAETDLAALEFQSKTQNDRQMGSVLDVRADLEIAKHELEAKQSLDGQHIFSRFDLARSEVTVEKMSRKLELEKKALEDMQRISAVQAALGNKAVGMARRNLADAESAVQSLNVLATAPGVVQEIFVSPGEFVAEGEKLATIADPDTLVATLRVSQNSAEGIALGSSAVLNVNGREVRAKVINVNPRVLDGLVSVDLDFAANEGFTPKPNEALTGEIAVDRQPGKLYVNRTPGIDPNTSSYVEVAHRNGILERELVQFGTGSPDTVEIIGAGIIAGDRLILERRKSASDKDDSR